MPPFSEKEPLNPAVQVEEVTSAGPVLTFGKSRIQAGGPCYVIAEIGHNHQGSLEKARLMIETAARCGVNAVKFQKRSNRSLYTREMYDRPYDHENSFGATYGEHREKLEFGLTEYRELKDCAEAQGVEFMCTAFDLESLDFVDTLGVTSFKFASGDLTNIPLLTAAAARNKPIFLSTGAASLEEIRIAYGAIRRHHDQLCLLHCVCEYPAEYANLNLNIIKTLRREFPDVLIGYSGHDNGILAPVIAYSMGAVVVEKHFTLNRSLKGTDHRFSLEPEGLRKQVRDLRRLDVMLGEEEKVMREYEAAARQKMGKSLYASRNLPAGHVLTEADFSIRSPGGAFMPYEISRICGRQLKKPLRSETLLTEDFFENPPA